jgi:glyoxylase-like metal-dependent hydrolase (beta-lactamase superfamily II)
MQRLADGLWRWTARHPEWHPSGEFGAEVACFAVHADGDTLLIDPLLPGGPERDALLAELDGLVTGRVHTLITIPYHVRSAEQLWTRYGAEIWGDPACGRRLHDLDALQPFAAGDRLPCGVTAYAIGSPRRLETPLYVPSCGALVFGDALVTVGGRLRVWIQAPITEQRLAWYRNRLVPTLEPLRSLDADRVLVTHGQPVLRSGARQLEQALAAPPWYHPPT